MAKKCKINKMSGRISKWKIFSGAAGIHARTRLSGGWSGVVSTPTPPAYALLRRRRPNEFNGFQPLAPSFGSCLSKTDKGFEVSTSKIGVFWP